MSQPTIAAGRHTLDGTVRVFLAESLLLPTGLATLAFLTRQLGAGGYGLFILAAQVVTWIEWSITTLTARAVNKCVSEATDWRPVATTVLHLHLAVSVPVAVALALLAGPLAKALGQPVLTGYLQLFALDIPLFCLAQAHRNILIGLGHYRQRAWLGAGRWLVRLVLVFLLVGCGLAVNGAIWSLIGASAVELIVARRLIQPPFWARSNFPVRRLLTTALPLFVLGICLRLFDRIDLFILSRQGASAAQAGLYGAAGNLALLPALFSQAFSPLLLATLTRLRRAGQEAHARAMARDAMRLTILMLPFAAMTAGAASEIVRLVAGPQFTGAAALLRALIFAAVGSALISVATGVLIAADRSWWTVGVGGPTIFIAAGALCLAIPKWGPQGAANVMTGSAWLGAALAVILVAIHWRIAPPFWSVARALVVSGAAYAAARAWSTPGALVVLKLAVLSAGVVAGYIGLREFDERERQLAWSLIPWQRNSPS